MPWDSGHRPAWLPGGRPPWPVVMLGLLAQVPTVAIAVRTHTPALVVVAVLAVLGALAVAAARRVPAVTVPVVGALVGGALLLIPGAPFAAVPLALSIGIAVFHARRLACWLTIAGLGLGLPLIGLVVLGRTGAGLRPLAVMLALSLVIAFAEGMRSRRERFRRLGERLAVERQADADAERSRIARELHDVVAHSLSQISVQAGVGLHLFDQRPEAAREALRAIRLSSGDALNEVRGVLAMLGGDGGDAGDDQPRDRPAAPEPTLARLDDLVTEARVAGVRVDLEREVPGEVSAPVQRAVYRIVQESLTNIRRHARATAVVISVRTDDDVLAVIVTNDGASSDGVEEGRGIRGMRERASLAGGRLSAGPTGDGSFSVDARIPLVSAMERGSA